MGSSPPAQEGVVAVAAQEGELVGLGLGPLQPDEKAPAMLGGDSELRCRDLVSKTT